MSRSEPVVTRAILLARREVDEETIQVSVLTRDFGRLTVFAKNPRWERVLTMTPGSFGSAVVKEGARGEGGRTYLQGYDRETLGFREALSFGYYAAVLTVLESVFRLLPVGDPHPALYDDVERALTILSSARRPEAVALAFLLQMISRLGYRWDTRRCAVCGRTMNCAAVLVPVDGEFRCAACGRDAAPAIPVSKAAVVGVSNMLRLPLHTAATLSLPPAVVGEIARMLSVAIRCYFDKELGGLLLVHGGVPAAGGGSRSLPA